MGLSAIIDGRGLRTGARMPKIDEQLRRAFAENASDIHISAGEPIRIRVDGDLQVVSPNRLSAEEVQELLFEILTEDERQKLVAHKNLDKSMNISEGHFRVNMFYTRRGLASVLRTIPKKIPTMKELGLPESIVKLTDLPKGLVLVTGPTGSGKSTTLASMLHHINCNFKYHILTVEDPVEFVHESRESLINQREIGAHCPTFSDALKYALREDPDVILVGEMRDLETISLALTAAETGHLVFGTLHTRGAAASVDRIIDSFPANQQAMIRTMLSESLAAVISQCLIKRAGGKGRAAAYEILIVNTAIANLIREGKTFQMPSIIQTARKEGMVLMEQSILELVQKKIILAKDALPYLEDPAILGPAAKTGNTSSSISILTQSVPSIKTAGGSKPPAASPKLAAPPKTVIPKVLTPNKIESVPNVAVVAAVAPAAKSDSSPASLTATIPGNEPGVDLLGDLSIESEVSETSEVSEVSVLPAISIAVTDIGDLSSEFADALSLDEIPLSTTTDNIELSDSSLAVAVDGESLMTLPENLDLAIDLETPELQTASAPIAQSRSSPLLVPSLAQTLEPTVHPSKTQSAPPPAPAVTATRPTPPASPAKAPLMAQSKNPPTNQAAPREKAAPPAKIVTAVPVKTTAVNPVVATPAVEKGVAKVAVPSPPAAPKPAATMPVKAVPIRPGPPLPQKKAS